MTETRAQKLNKICTENERYAAICTMVQAHAHELTDNVWRSIITTPYLMKVNKLSYPLKTQIFNQIKKNIVTNPDLPEYLEGLSWKPIQMAGLVNTFYTVEGRPGYKWLKHTIDMYYTPYAKNAYSEKQEADKIMSLFPPAPGSAQAAKQTQRTHAQKLKDIRDDPRAVTRAAPKRSLANLQPQNEKKSRFRSWFGLGGRNYIRRRRRRTHRTKRQRNKKRRRRTHRTKRRRVKKRRKTRRR
jgi:hypothetical protein